MPNIPIATNISQPCQCTRLPTEPGFQMPVHYLVYIELSIKTQCDCLPIPLTLLERAANAQADNSGDRICLVCFKNSSLILELHQNPMGSWNSSLAGKLPENSGYISWGRAVSQLCSKSGAILKDFQRERTVEDEEFGRQTL